MAVSKPYYHHRFFSSNPHAPPNSDPLLELTESDVWNSPEPRKPAKKFSSPARNSGERKSIASSVPVNIPDWAKILKEEYRENRRRESDDDEDEDFDDRIPPHEFLARQRIASFSVHEGVGRTLKGRDLSRVRNAIWEKIGFQD